MFVWFIFVRDEWESQAVFYTGIQKASTQNDHGPVSSKVTAYEKPPKYRRAIISLAHLLAWKHLISGRHP